VQFLSLLDLLFSVVAVESRELMRRMRRRTRMREARLARDLLATAIDRRSIEQGGWKERDREREPWGVEERCAIVDLPAIGG
jgi:hypothetical protein